MSAATAPSTPTASPGGAPFKLRDVALTLAIGAAGGAIFNYFSLPLAWMIGAMCLTTAASLAGAPITMPPGIRKVMIAVLGIMLGSAFSPAMITNLYSWLPSLAALFFYTATVTAILSVYFRRAFGYSWPTAYFSASPGGLNEMVMIGGEMGGDERTISLIHACRVLFVVMTVPFIFTVLEGYDPGTRPPLGGAIGDIALVDLLILAASGVVGVFAARALRVPAANITGPMMLSAALHLAGLTDSRPPGDLVAIAQLVIGCAIGARFAGVPMAIIGRTLLIGFGATVVMLAVTFGFAALLEPLIGVSVTALVLALAPGGLAEMSLIALALGIDAAYVSTHHIARIIIIIILAPILYRRAAARDPRLRG